MSRFAPSRIGSIAAWTGAAVAWAATLVSGALQPSSPVQPQASPDRPAVVSSETLASLPSLPATGIVIVRSAVEPARAVVVAPPSAPPATSPPVKVSTPPQPQSSGS